MNARLNKARLQQLDENYQLVIIGGGIYGAALCWEASHRGIKTLLVEQEDYASGASANSLKTIHGGLRALQSVNLAAVVKGIKERAIFLRISPNYVEPLACMLPTTKSLMKSRLVVGMGLLLYNMISLPFVSAPNTRLLSRNKFFSWAQGLCSEGVTGGALWYDAQVTNTERLVWQFIKSAIDKGAKAINHAVAVKVDGSAEAQKQTLLIRDQLNDEEKMITASCIVDCSAAWGFIKNCKAEKAGAENNQGETEEDLTFLKSVNIIVRKKLFEKAVGVNVKAASDGHSRLFFFSPWRNCLIIGTWYSRVQSYPDNLFSYEEASACIEEINAAFTEDLLTVDDICNVHVGYLPALKNQHADPAALDQDLISNYQFKDWSSHAGLFAVYSLRGTKYTLARHDARQVIDRLARNMRWDVTASHSDSLPIYRAAQVTENKFSLPDEVLQNLIKNYGDDIEQLYVYLEQDAQNIEPIPATKYHIRAEVYHAVFHEQALSLTDLLKRRLDTGDREPPAMVTVEYCAQLMQVLLTWSEQETQMQIKTLYASYPDFVLRNMRLDNYFDKDAVS